MAAATEHGSLQSTFVVGLGEKAGSPPGVLTGCLFCLARFEAAALSRHERVAHAKAFRCTGCNRKFSSREDARRHSRQTQHAIPFAYSFAANGPPAQPAQQPPGERTSFVAREFAHPPPTVGWEPEAENAPSAPAQTRPLGPQAPPAALRAAGAAGGPVAPPALPPPPRRRRPVVWWTAGVDLRDRGRPWSDQEGYAGHRVNRGYRDSHDGSMYEMGYGIDTGRAESPASWHDWPEDVPVAVPPLPVDPPMNIGKHPPPGLPPPHSRTRERAAAACLTTRIFYFLLPFSPPGVVAAI